MMQFNIIRPLVLSVGLLFLNSFSVKAQQDIKAEIMTEVNSKRHSGCMCGDEYMPPAKALKWNVKLEKAAVKHARDMHLNDHFDHTGSDGSTLTERIRSAGYEWSLIGENLAWGVLTPEEVVKGWIHSPSHCRTMINPSFREMGAARKGKYWVLELGVL